MRGNGPGALDRDRVGQQQDLPFDFIEAAAVKAAEGGDESVEKHRIVGHRRHGVRKKTELLFQRLERRPGFFGCRADRLKVEPLHCNVLLQNRM